MFSAARDGKYVRLGVKDAEVAQRGFWCGDRFFFLPNLGSEKVILRCPMNFVVDYI